MEASAAIVKLVALLEQNPGLKTKLMSIGNIDDAVALVKEQGLAIAKKELQEYMVKNLAGSALTKALGGNAGALGDIANAASALGGLFGKK